jgi:hypothetical protein
VVSSGWGPKAERSDTRVLKQWVREELDLPEDTTVVVSELTCTEPGCPPLETVVSVFPEGMDSLLVKWPSRWPTSGGPTWWQPWPEVSTTTERRPSPGGAD